MAGPCVTFSTFACTPKLLSVPTSLAAPSSSFLRMSPVAGGLPFLSRSIGGKQYGSTGLASGFSFFCGRVIGVSSSLRDGSGRGADSGCTADGVCGTGAICETGSVCGTDPRCTAGSDHGAGSSAASGAVHGAGSSAVSGSVHDAGCGVASACTASHGAEASPASSTGCAPAASGCPSCAVCALRPRFLSMNSGRSSTFDSCARGGVVGSMVSMYSCGASS